MLYILKKMGENPGNIRLTFPQLGALYASWTSTLLISPAGRQQRAGPEKIRNQPRDGLFCLHPRPRATAAVCASLSAAITAARDACVPSAARLQQESLRTPELNFALSWPVLSCVRDVATSCHFSPPPPLFWEAPENRTPLSPLASPPRRPTLPGIATPLQPTPARPYRGPRQEK